MPFQKGNKLSRGRKTFELEQRDKKRIIALLRRYLTLGELIALGKATEIQKKAFESLSSLTLKILDKLQANKTDLKIEVDKPLLILK